MKKESENQKVKELGHGMSTEELSALYFDENALIETPEKVFRLNTSGNRYYYTFPDEYSAPQFFVSVTTMIKQTLPTSPFLIDWIADNSKEGSRNIAADRAAYGTFMHIQIADFLINKTYNLDELRSKLKAYIEEEKLPVQFINNADELKKDMLSFAQFAIETNLKALAIEVVLTHPTDGYAGALDLVCEFDGAINGFHGEVFKSGKKVGQPRKTKIQKRVRAILDFKSGRKGFFESAKIQLKAYQTMWNLRFPDFTCDYIFNWAPKEWRGSTPTYNLEDQTQAKENDKLPFLVELARVENRDMSNTVVSCSGIMNLGDELVHNIQELTLSELVSKKKKVADTPKQTEQSPIEEIAGKKAVTSKNKPKKKRSNTNTKVVVKKTVKPRKKKINPKDLGI